MLITCQADHNKHAINERDRLTDCNFMTDYTVAIYKSYKGGKLLYILLGAQNIFLYECTNGTCTEERGSCL